MTNTTGPESNRPAPSICQPALLRLTCFAVLVLLAFSACREQRQQADLILVNGHIITVDDRFSIKQALAVGKGKILATGNNDRIRQMAHDGTVVIDLEGRTVIPGLIDAHTHLLSASRSEYHQPIPDIGNIGQLLDWIAMRAGTADTGEWVVHPVFFATRLQEMRPPTLAELDSVAPHLPVFLDGSYGGMVNSRAMTASGLDTLSVPGVLTGPDGMPTGMLRDQALAYIRKQLPLPEPPAEQIQMKLLEEMLHRYNSVGITSVCAGSGTPEDWQLFSKLKNEGKLTVRVFQNMYPPFDIRAGWREMLDAMQQFPFRTGQGDEWLRVGALKVVVDGGVLTGTACLREPWGRAAADIYGIKDPEYRGILYLPKDKLIDIIRIADRFGWKFAAHATGGGGVDEVLAALEEVNRTSPLRGKRYSVIHGNFLNKAAIGKMAELGVYADMQPAWYLLDAGALRHILGEKRMAAFHPYRDLLTAGIVINGGSDHMAKLDPDSAINPYNPFVAMWVLVARKTINGQSFFPEQRIGRREALRIYTINNARATFEEQTKGSLEPGKWADLVILSADILTCATDSIRYIRPELTMVGGRIVYSDSSWAGILQEVSPEFFRALSP